MTAWRSEAWLCVCVCGGGGGGGCSTWLVSRVFTNKIDTNPLVCY